MVLPEVTLALVSHALVAVIVWLVVGERRGRAAEGPRDSPPRGGPPKVYERAAEALETEQGEWYVNHILERELYRISKKYVRYESASSESDSDSSDDYESDDGSVDSASFDDSDDVEPFDDSDDVEPFDDSGDDEGGRKVAEQPPARAQRRKGRGRAREALRKPGRKVGSWELKGAEGAAPPGQEFVGEDLRTEKDGKNVTMPNWSGEAKKYSRSTKYSNEGPAPTDQAFVGEDLRTEKDGKNIIMPNWGGDAKKYARATKYSNQGPTAFSFGRVDPARWVPSSVAPPPYLPGSARGTLVSSEEHAKGVSLPPPSDNPPAARDQAPAATHPDE